jgi:hypothetical protein
MKSKINIFLFVLIISWSFRVNAQEEQFNSSIEMNNLINKEFVSVQNADQNNAKTSNSYLLNNNMIQISQIGYSNYADVNVKSNNAKMTINQDGSSNYLEVYKSAKQINQSIVQTGNNNFISDFSLYSGAPVDMSFSQEGNNLSIFNNGSNSISKDLKISQTGNTGSVYIFNR